MKALRLRAVPPVVIDGALVIAESRPEPGAPWLLDADAFVLGSVTRESAALMIGVGPRCQCGAVHAISFTSTLNPRRLLCGRTVRLILGN